MIEAQPSIAELTETRKAKGKITFVNTPVKVFGGLFNDPYVLDISVTKYCFQGCFFCFANINRRVNDSVVGKVEDPTDQIYNLFNKANGPGYNPNNFMEYLVHHKYPIMFSNNVDPFMPESEEQFKIGERVLTWALEFKQKLFIQTKEVYYGPKIRDLIIQGKDLFQLYVSISTLDESKAKIYETVRVTPAMRLKRIRDLADHGVDVTVALNPYVPEWQPDLVSYFETTPNEAR